MLGHIRISQAGGDKVKRGKEKTKPGPLGHSMDGWMFLPAWSLRSLGTNFQPPPKNTTDDVHLICCAYGTKKLNPGPRTSRYRPTGW